MTHDFKLEIIIGGTRMAVNPHEHSIETGGDETERQHVPACVRSLVAGVLEGDGAALQAPLVRNRFWNKKLVRSVSKISARKFKVAVLV